MEEKEEMNMSSMEDVVKGMDEANAKLRKGQIVEATISSADENGLQVMLSGHFTKKEIFVDKDAVDCEVYSKEAYAEKAANNEKINLVVIATNPIKLSEKEIRLAKEEAEKIADIEAGNEFEVTCEGFNKGGLTAKLGSYQVFVPAKEIRSGYVKDLEKQVGKKLRLKCMEIKRGEYKKEIIASQRVILEAEKKAREEAKAAKEAEFFNMIQEGDIVEGEVKRVGKDKSGRDFGAFVSVGGFDCLAHISDLAWNKVKNVTDVLEIGKKYEFKVMKVDREAKKVSISYKELQPQPPQPWEVLAMNYNVGDVIHGKVARLTPFGAFIEVMKGVDGLVHVSQISHEWLADPQSVLHKDDEVDAKILKLDAAEKKLTLSIKALAPEPEVKKVTSRKPAEKQDDEAKEPKQRKSRGNKNPDEMTEYKDEESVSGFSIMDLRKKN